MPHLVFSFCFCISQVNKLLIDAITFFREQNFQVLWGSIWKYLLLDGGQTIDQLEYLATPPPATNLLK